MEAVDYVKKERPDLIADSRETAKRENRVRDPIVNH
jgi:hypothetical protein